MTLRETPLEYPFRQRLKQLRQERNLTQKQIGEAVGLSSITVSGWEIGKSLPDAQTLPILADFLDVSIDFLLGREDLPQTDHVHQVLFVPVFATLRLRHGKLQCLDYLGSHPAPAELAPPPGSGRLLFTVAPPFVRRESGLSPGDRIALWVGLPFRDDELCGVLIGDLSLKLLHVKRISEGDESGYSLRGISPDAPEQIYIGLQADTVHIVGPCAGIWKPSQRLGK